MENAKDNNWTDIYDNITNYNDWSHKPLSNAKIIEAIYLEEQAEVNYVTVDTFSPQINKSGDLIDKVTNLTNKGDRE